MGGSTLLLLFWEGGGGTAFDPCAVHYRGRPEEAIGARPRSEESFSFVARADETTSARPRPEDC